MLALQVVEVQQLCAELGAPARICGLLGHDLSWCYHESLRIQLLAFAINSRKSDEDRVLDGGRFSHAVCVGPFSGSLGHVKKLLVVVAAVLTGTVKVR